MRFRLALLLAKLIIALMNMGAKWDPNLPGNVALKLDPCFAAHIKGLDPERTIFVTGSNGKTTTVNLLAGIFKEAGLSAAANLSGENELGSVAAALIENCTLGGRLKAEYVIMETDERWLPYIYKMLPARNIVVTNIQKDQLQRNGEPELVRRKIASVIGKDTRLFVNGDEPNAFSLGPAAGECISFGVDGNSKSFDKSDDFFSVTAPCPICHGALEFKHYNVDNVGAFSCPECGFRSGENGCRASDVDFSKKTFSVNGRAYSFKYNTPYFLYCYTAALAVAREFGIDENTVARAFGEFTLQAGRMEVLNIAGKQVKFLRMKQENAETLQSAINAAADDTKEKAVFLGIGRVTDASPLYSNSCFLFDCDFRRLIDSNLSKTVCFTELAAYDAALKLKYDGIDGGRVVLLPTDDNDALLSALAECECDNIYLITFLDKYIELLKHCKIKSNCRA